MYVIPTKGFTVRDPITKRTLPPEGAEVPDNVFWRRRLRDRDVAVGEPPIPEAASAPPSSGRPKSGSSAMLTGAQPAATSAEEPVQS